MTSLKLPALLVLLAGLVAAQFNISSYLYADENTSQVGYANFTLNGTSYSLVTIGGTESFLLKNGEPVTNQTVMESVMYSYYVKSYYPSDDDLQELRDLIEQFNASRNNGYDFKNKEEYVCRDDILLSNGKINVSGQLVRCTDNESCTRNALLLYAVYGDALGLGSASVIVQPLMDFTPASLRMDELINDYRDGLDNLDDSNMAETLEYIADTSGELRPLSLKIESTIFRTPRLNDSADRKACEFKCWAVCPSFDLDQAAADDIEELAGELADQVAPLQDYKSTTASLYNQTQSRMLYVRDENMETYYRDIFRPLNESGAEAISLGQEALSHVANKSLSDKMDDLKSLHATIPEDINSHNFTGMDGSIAEYTSLTDSVDEAAGFLLKEYNETLEAKNVENSLLLILESKDLDPVSAKSLEVLRNKTEDLDAEFRDGLNVAQLQELEGEYEDLSKDAEELLKSESDTPATRVILLFRGFARKVNGGIAQFAEATDVMPKEKVPESPWTLGLFSLSVFLAGASAVIIFFLYIISSVRFTIPKTTHILGAAFLTLIVLLLVFTVFMYLFLNKTSTDATLPEYLADLNSKNSTSIVMDLRNASFSDVQAIRSCAGNLAGSLEEKNKTWSMYTLTPNTCTETDSSGGNSSFTADECLGKIDSAESAFILSYSPTNEPPRFAVIYQNRAEIRANLDYYESCPLVALLS